MVATRSEVRMYGSGRMRESGFTFYWLGWTLDLVIFQIQFKAFHPSSDIHGMIHLDRPREEQCAWGLAWLSLLTSQYITQMDL